LWLCIASDAWVAAMPYNLLPMPHLQYTATISDLSVKSALKVYKCWLISLLSQHVHKAMPEHMTCIGDSCTLDSKVLP